MKGRVYAYGDPCPCGGEWRDVTDGVTGDCVNIVCGVCLRSPTRFAIDGRSFKNRRGTVGRLFRDPRGDLYYAFHAAKQSLEAIRADWRDKGKERFDPTKWSTQGRESYKLAECAKEWRLHLERSGKSRAYTVHVELFFRLHILPGLPQDIDIREITGDDVEKLQLTLKEKGLSQNTVKSALQVLMSLMHRYCVRKQVIDRVPPFPEKWSAGVFVERHEVTVAEQRGLMARLVMSYPKTVRYRMLLLQKTYTALGCRPGEAHGLRRMDILEDGRVKIQGAINPVTGAYGPRKTKDQRTTPVPLPDGLLADLRALPVLPGGFLFVDESGLPWNQNRVSDRFGELCGIRSVTYYTYSKHSLATRTVRESVAEGKRKAAGIVGVTGKVLDGHYLLER